MSDKQQQQLPTLKERNEESLFDTFNVWPLEIILECLSSTGSIEKQIQLDQIDKVSAVSQLVDDVRNLGIEAFVQKLPIDVAEETCSLLELPAANSDDVDDTKQEIEFQMKSEALVSYFNRLTPHLLYTYCIGSGMKLAKSFQTSSPIKPPSSSNTSGNTNNNNNNTTTLSTPTPATHMSITIVNSTPIVKVLENTTIISTHTTKSSTQRYNGTRPMTLGEGIFEGSSKTQIMKKLLIEEILLIGVENILYHQSLDTLVKICKVLNVKENIPSKFSEVVSIIVPYLFYHHTPTPSPPSLSPDLNLQQKQQQQNKNYNYKHHNTPHVNKYIPTIDNNNNSQPLKRKYPETPGGTSANSSTSTDTSDSSASDDSSSNQSNHDDVEEKVIKKKKNSNSGKLQFTSQMSTDEEDKEIDSPADHRLTIADIKEGIKKEQLKKIYLKDLQQWLRSKNLKADDRKPILIEKILSYFQDGNNNNNNNNNSKREASESDTDGGKTNNNISK